MGSETFEYHWVTETSNLCMDSVYILARDREEYEKGVDSPI